VTDDLPSLEPRLFWLDPVALGADAEAVARAWSWLDEEERARHAAIASDRQRTEFLAAHALLRGTLSRFGPLAPAAWRFVRDAHGAPRLAAGHGCEWLRFSLAHTAGLVAVAVARDRAVGVDVEDRERSLDWRSVARTGFAPDEAAGLEAQATEELRRERFFALWTLKEAYLKARGLGLALPLRDVAFAVDGEGGDSLTEPRTGLLDGRPAWRFARFSPTARHRVAACVARAAGDGECRWVAEGVTPAGL
jgi:4'-phosphopantetheinyl transferase